MCQMLMPCCSSFNEYSQMAMNLIDKALGNIFKSHKDINFIALLNVKNQRASIIHYLAKKKLYDDVSVPMENVDLADHQQEYLHAMKVEKA